MYFRKIRVFCISLEISLMFVSNCTNQNRPALICAVVTLIIIIITIVVVIVIIIFFYSLVCNQSSTP